MLFSHKKAIVSYLLIILAVVATSAVIFSSIQDNNSPTGAPFVNVRRQILSTNPCGDGSCSFTEFCPADDRVCTTPNGAGKCMFGCKIASCNANFADCDTSVRNGCESNLQSDANNCGACGNICPFGKTCQAGSCLTALPICTESDWQFSLFPTLCPSDGAQQKVWSKIGSCAGGVTHPSTETIPCTQPCTSYTYSAWSSCSSSGTQTRNISSSTPVDCSGGLTPVLSQTCSYLPACTESDWQFTLFPPTCQSSGTQDKNWAKTRSCTGGVYHQPTEPITCTPPCVSYAYSAWGACQPTSIQTRTVASTTPAQCANGATPQLTQSCTYIPPCTSYHYGPWSACSADGTQTRSFDYSIPSGCQGGVQPVLTGTCIPPCSSHTYSAWSACDASGTQTRTLLSSTPSICQGGTAPILSQSCIYIPPCTENNWQSTISPPSCPSNSQQTKSWTKTGTCTSGVTHPFTETITCVYTAQLCQSYSYSAWSSCSSSGTQTRTVTSSSPSDCQGGTPPVLSGTCTPPCSSYTYSGWSACASSGTQTRTITSSSPSGCQGGAAPQLSQYCSYIRPCAGSNWLITLIPSDCPSTGQQTRYWGKIGNCAGGVTHPGYETISCTYVVPPCTENDWQRGRDIGYGECYTTAARTFIQIYTKTGVCEGGVYHDAQEIRSCPAGSNPSGGNSNVGCVLTRYMCTAKIFGCPYWYCPYGGSHAA